MSEAVIGLSSDSGTKSEQLLAGVQALSRLPGVRICGISSIFLLPAERNQTETQHSCAVRLETEVSPLLLLGACLGIECAMGRRRGGARVIDLDVLLYEGVKSETYELTLPHPRLTACAAALLPLKELYHSGRAPGIFFEPFVKELDMTGISRLSQRIEMS